MTDPIAIHRRELSQRLQTLSDQGGWEGTHTDYKEQLSSAPRDYAKLLKHILAFANTPRRTDAYIIFGVAENKNEGKFSHVGVSIDQFPPHETLQSLLRPLLSSLTSPFKRLGLVALLRAFSTTRFSSAQRMNGAFARCPAFAWCRYCKVNRGYA